MHILAVMLTVHVSEVSLVEGKLRRAAAEGWPPGRILANPRQTGRIIDWAGILTSTRTRRMTSKLGTYKGIRHGYGPKSTVLQPK